MCSGAKHHQNKACMPHPVVSSVYMVDHSSFQDVANAREERIRVVERKLLQMIDLGNSRRAVSATLLNAESSRSHAIVMV